MNDKFLSYIRQEKLFRVGQKILLAVSGGIDSMVLLDLFYKSNIEIGVAHVNHHLRDHESDDDAVFVRNYCAKNSIPYFEKSLDKTELLKGNMHQNSRILRYAYFKEILESNHYDFIATAHHKDDAIETFLINLMRGTGIAGLDGIPVKNKNVIRPLLFATKDEIETYASENQLNYRTDSSNQQDKYLRNKIRHHIIPMMYAIDERSRNGLSTTMKNLISTQLLLKSSIEHLKSEYVKEEFGVIKISLVKIRDFDQPLYLLCYLLSPYEFNTTQCKNILKDGHISGAGFISQFYEAIIDRDVLLIRTIDSNTEASEVLILNNFEDTIHWNKSIIQFYILDKKDEFSLSDNIQYLDADAIKFPIIIRKWQEGDKIIPLGMHGRHQKVKRILINKKISNFDKEKIPVLISANEVQCVIGVKISEKVKIKPTTKNVLSIKIS